MNIFLLGARGYLGSYLASCIDVDTDIVSGKKYDYFINCSSRTSLEYCERNPDESFVSNFQAMVDTHKKLPDSKVITFSSYYVYDDEEACSEISRTTDRYQYSKHKLLSERYVLQRDGLVFRLGKLFGNPSAIQMRLTETILNARSITLDRVSFNPTSVNQVATVVQHELKTQSLIGLYNLSNTGSATHLSYGQYITSKTGSNITIEPVDKLVREFHNYGRFLMSTEKLGKLVLLKHWKEDIKEYLLCTA